MSSVIDMLDKIDEQQKNEEVDDNKKDGSVNIYKQTQNYSGFYMMVNFISKHKSDIPDGLRNKCMQNEYGITLAMYWLRIMKDYVILMVRDGRINETVPKWMRHNPEVRDNCGWTIAMHWVTIFNCDVPLWMRHDPSMQNVKGKTTGMFYLMCNRGELGELGEDDGYLPPWMRHDGNIFDEDGNGIIDYWFRFTKLDLPTWIRIHIENIDSFANKNNETIAMSWIIHRKTIPPIEFKCDINLKTSYDMTIVDIFEKVMSYSNTSSNWIIDEVDKTKHDEEIVVEDKELNYDKFICGDGGVDSNCSDNSDEDLSKYILH
ncbi:MAG: hypothetical protein ACOX6N_04885 [Patescibacteria group bacterium]|jgi:hypothetical protein